MCSRCSINRSGYQSCRGQVVSPGCAGVGGGSCSPRQVRMCLLESGCLGLPPVHRKWELWPSSGPWGPQGQAASYSFSQWVAGGRVSDPTGHCPPSLSGGKLFCVLLGPGSSRGEGDIPQQEPHKLEGGVQCFSPVRDRSQAGGGDEPGEGDLENTADAGSHTGPVARNPGSHPSSAGNSQNPCSHALRGHHRTHEETESPSQDVTEQSPLLRVRERP